MTVLATVTPAEAARKKKRVTGYSPPYAAMVIDAKSGRTLHAVNEDALRHPASITKVMTLYMLFEQMERGRFRMDSELRVSARAAARPPSKIGVRPGETIEVSDAIRALITKSANDVASVVAENIAGDEDTFAEQMTRRARSLGMSRTTFKNASGLPDSEQVTTARDLTILARAIQERFPRQFHLFQTRNFEYAGRNYRNHNKLLGRVEGVDGIKTGFTRASGFNLMTSAKADGRHIVSIVLGGRSGASRDNIMAGLVVAHLPRASTGPQRVMVAQAQEPETRPEPRAESRAEIRAERAQAAPVAERARVAEAPAVQQAAAPQATANAVLAPRPQPRPIEIAAIRPMTASAAAAAFAPPTPTSTSAQAARWATSAPQPGATEARPNPANAQAAIQRAAPAAQPQPLRPPAAVASAPQPVQPASPAQRIAPAATAFAPTPGPAARAPDSPRPPANVQFTSSVAKAPEQVETPARAASAWVIQIGATDDEGKAKGMLSNARGRSSTLADARPFTETVERGGATLWRARFAGFDDQSEADKACRDLKRSGFSCFATRG
jgi:D-alanyl-D-alanine carboxypeptidase